MPPPKVWKERFIEALREGSPSIKSACEHAGVSKTTVYAARRTDPKFADAWAEVNEIRLDEVEAALLHRAVGWYEPVYNKAGQVIGQRWKGDTLAGIFLLKANRPGIYRDPVNPLQATDAQPVVIELPAKQIDAQAQSDQDAE